MQIGQGGEIKLPDVGSGFDKARFEMKVGRFIDEHVDHIALQKIRRAHPITKQDLDEREGMLVDLGVSDRDRLEEIDS